MMDTLLAVLVGVVVACAVHLMLSRDLFRVVLGAMMLTSSANLAVIVLGRTTRSAPAFVPPGADQVSADAVANPLPQAFVLTAIVIGLALFAFVLALVVPLARKLRTLDADGLGAAAPSTPRREGEPTGAEPRR
jgi:multicomponent Na+:H+ antiporter subunit C